MEFSIAEIATTVIDYLKSGTDTESVTLESHLTEDLGLDSIGLLMLADKIEEAFAIDMSEFDQRIGNRPRTVQDIVTMIHACGQSHAS